MMLPHFYLDEEWKNLYHIGNCRTKWKNYVKKSFEECTLFIHIQPI